MEIDWNGALNLIITGLVGIAISYMQGKLNRQLKEIDRKQDARDKVSYLILDGVDKTGALADATAEALQTGNTNGHVTEARKEYEEYKRKYNAVAREELARKV